MGVGLKNLIRIYKGKYLMPFLHTDCHSFLSIVEILRRLIAVVDHFLNIGHFDLSCSVKNAFVELFYLH